MITEEQRITLITILQDGFNGNKEAMAKYISNNLPNSVESLVI